MTYIRRRLAQEPLLRVVTALMIVTIIGLQGFMLWRARQDTWQEGVREAENVLNTLASNMERNLTILDLSLLGAQESVQEPDLLEISPSLRQRVLFDRAASAQFLGALLILDAEGNIRFASGSIQPRAGSFSDRDYFQVQKSPGVDSYVSTPFFSRIRNGEPSIALSRRISGADGSFQGIAVGSIRLAYFRSLFESVNLRAGSMLVLVRTDGALILRQPERDAVGAPSVNYSSTTVFRRMLAGVPQPFIARSQGDGVERVYLYKRFADFPLMLSVGMSVSTLFAEWNRSALVTGLLTAIVCVALALTVCALGTALRRSREMEAQLENLAVTDPLTGLPNRRALDIMLDSELRRARRDKQELSLLMIDADHFKRVNDTFGHTTGDLVLRQMGRLILGAIRRPGDFATRYGGEEFVVILPSTPMKGAQRIAENIRAAIAGETFLTTAGAPLHVTVSLGVTIAGAGDTPADIVSRSDDALYRAKGMGRNCVASKEPKALKDGASAELVSPSGFEPETP